LIALLRQFVPHGLFGEFAIGLRIPMFNVHGFSF
jgi:hypothetical protein